MRTSIAAVPPILTEVLDQLETSGEVWLIAETAEPVGPGYLPYLLSQLPPDECQFIATNADTQRAEFTAPDDSGYIGFEQRWAFPRKVHN